MILGETNDIDHMFEGGIPGGISDGFLSRLLKVRFCAGLKKSLDFKLVT